MGRKTVIDAINGDVEFDLVIKNVQLVNVITREVYASEIGIINGKIGHVNQPGEESQHALQPLCLPQKTAHPAGRRLHRACLCQRGTQAGGDSARAGGEPAAVADQWAIKTDKGLDKQARRFIY